MNDMPSAENDLPPLVCAFALHRGRYCMRPAGHEATDGRVPRHDSTGWDEWVTRTTRVILPAKTEGDR